MNVTAFNEPHDTHDNKIQITNKECIRRWKK